ncbi:class I SAM-dependent methyltransferase [Porphyromonas pogonae]|uniref:class I SAM-dependent methyltransferase n=1 Tax=Porphyromonas pogonae TaxID=867595 RepID=UPI002E7A4D84|nr:class I SAM-dependent methyltransferase [Porphyromonas pogonae]
MKEEKMNMDQGHWILAKLGKRVLRPGGRELTNMMMDILNITPQDDVVEFAPGMGYTASLAVARSPHSYTAIELNEEAADIVRKNIHYAKAEVVIANAAATGLADGCASRVYGEAMLTMQSDAQKESIIREASRLLRPGGMYGIHEVGLYPDDISEDIKDKVRVDMMKSIRVNVRPLTRLEWCALLEKHGFEIVAVRQNAMHLLERDRMIADEGFWRFLGIVIRMMFHPKARARVIQMRKTFRRHADHINAISIVARKLK